ncbi:unnamed protein product [Strongylus vulgaris]|uniref:Protein kinase domain-containing protein n=1 Tax=Strongylus vulgaris TaxID=40348 RepID=A0A3P7KY18_STRVU|nr:unnamed protein product [Strongylus vulgaris]
MVFESEERYDAPYKRIVPVQQKDTRLAKDFMLQRCLGRGAFGEVYQARNKLDWSDYAVKCIPLDLTDEVYSRKITREAKLFSKLNHPNIVRYFNAWIENVATLRQESSSYSTSSESENSPPRLIAKKLDFDEDEKYRCFWANTHLRTISNLSVLDSLLPSRLQNIEVAAGGLQVDANEWTASCKGKERPSSSEEESSEDESEQVRPNARSTDAESSIDILFENEDSSSASKTPTSQSEDLEPSSFHSPESGPAKAMELSHLISPTSPVGLERILFIQMEYCGGGTLRKYIDDCHTVGKPNVIWKLFAEILSALGYIHRQGMIHRDVKPTNILLDVEGHIKIGDFGLATKGLLLKRSQTPACASTSESVEQALTKDIGTELYMAPELFDVNNSEPYTSKIDVYSTGVVFFEMCYHPIATGMERHAIINEVKNYLTFPPDFGDGFSMAQARHIRSLICNMLESEAELRPSVEEIMRDSLVPLVDYEDKQFKNIFNVSMKNRNRTYYWVLDTLTKEEQLPARAYCYDQDICKEKFAGGRDGYFDRLRDDLSSVLRMHAFVPLYTHLLVPKSKNALESWASMRAKPAVMMDTHGNTVMLPVSILSAVRCFLFAFFLENK